MKENNLLLKSKIERLEDVEENYEELLKEFHALSSSHSTLIEEHSLLHSERDSLTTIIQQKDSLLQLQNSQNIKSLSFLHSKQAQTSTNGNISDHPSMNHPLAETIHRMIIPQDYLLLQQQIKVLLSLTKDQPNPNNPSTSSSSLAPFTSFTSPNEPPTILEISNLLIILKEVQEKLILHSQIFKLYENEKMLRKELEKKLLNSLQLLKNDEILKKNLQEKNDILSKQVSELIYLQKINIATVSESSSTSSSSAASDAAAVTAAVLSTASPLENPFIIQIEFLKKENSLLKSQLETTQTNYTSSKEELLNTQKIMQKEFSQLWLSIKELTNLDQIKDKSIEELINERTNLLKENEILINKLNFLSEQCNQQQKELKVGRFHFFSFFFFSFGSFLVFMFSFLFFSFTLA
jgi:chromosome segregation ATPase